MSTRRQRSLPASPIEAHSYRVPGWWVIVIVEGLLVAFGVMIVYFSRTYALGVAVVVAAVAVILGHVRPRLVVNDAGVRVVNPFWTYTVGWHDIERFDVGSRVYLYRLGGARRITISALYLAASRYNAIHNRAAIHAAKELNAMLGSKRKINPPQISVAPGWDWRGILVMIVICAGLFVQFIRL